MKKILVLVSLLTLSTFSFSKDININKSKGTKQTSIVSLAPTPAQIDVDQNVVIKTAFDTTLDEKHIQKNNIKLKHLSQNKEAIIGGTIGYESNENTVTFKPHLPLAVGYYELEIKSLKTSKLKKDQHIKEIKYRFYVPEVINGHKLPPEPDKTLNNSTLLGIDVNKNKVRDDVERWVYINYKDKHPVYVDIAMQAGRVYRQVLETPERAKEIRLSVNSPYFCASYYKNYAKFLNRPTLVEERIDVPVKSIYFNTKARKDVYWEYDRLLSGDSYSLPGIREMKSQCDFNTAQYEE